MVYFRLDSLAATKGARPGDRWIDMSDTEPHQSQQRDISEGYILSFGRESSEAELREETNNTGNKLQFSYVNTFFSSAVLIEEYVPSNRLFIICRNHGKFTIYFVDQTFAKIRDILSHINIKKSF